MSADGGGSEARRWTDRAVLRMPFVGLFVMVVLLAALLVGGAETWHLATLGGIGGLLMAGMVRVLLFGLPSFVRQHVFLSGVLVAQSVGAMVIGGAASFGFIILVPTSMLAALVLERRYVAPVLAVPAVAIVVITAAQLAGVELVPEAFGPQSRMTLLLTTAVVALVAVVVGGGLGRLAQSSTLEAKQHAVDAQTALAEALAEQNRQLVGLTGAIAHELKNPLSAIQGLSKLMEGQPDVAPKQARRLRVLVEESERMGRILEEFLNFSRPVTDLSLASTTPLALLRDVAAIHEGMARERGVHVEVSDASEAAVTCDRRKVKQVLVNLVQNALDASPTGGTVRLTARASDGVVVMVVEDDGPGLSSELQDRAFDAGVTSKGGGTGLGLTIARSIAQQHGGTLVLKSGDAGGCRAELELPVGIVPATTSPSDIPTDGGDDADSSTV